MQTITITFDPNDPELREKLVRVAKRLPGLPFRMEGVGDIELRENSIVYNPQSGLAVQIHADVEFLPATKVRM